jgi:hypothetical protein
MLRTEDQKGTYCRALPGFHTIASVFHLMASLGLSASYLPKKGVHMIKYTAHIASMEKEP